MARLRVVVAIAAAFLAFVLCFGCRSEPPAPRGSNSAPIAPSAPSAGAPLAATPIAAPPADAHEANADGDPHAGHGHAADDPHGEDDPDHLADGKDHRALFVDRIPIAERNAVVDVAGLIESGGPFPYAKDGSVFQNRERRLPKQKAGFYREYTVDTPGSSDRGARRLVAGEDGSLYYTRDHYQTFVMLREARE
jgi:guanyl-specific ribonuclease Sa